MDPGLTAADLLAPGKGWLGAELRADNNSPVAVVVEGGMKINPNWAAYGDAWVRPTVGEFGADVGARYKNKWDIYAGAQGDTHGDYAGVVGLKFHWD